MISDYATLISQIISWADHDELTTVVAKDLIQLGEKRIYKEVRCNTMEATLSVSISSGVAALPSDFIELKSVRIAGSPDKPLGIMSSEQLYRAYPTRSSDSKPDFAALEAGNIIFGPYPDSDYTVKGIYYNRLTALSDGNTTNYFTDDGADALFFASLVEAEPFLKNDPRIVLWESKYLSAVDRINKEENRRKYRGAPLRMREA